MTMIRTRIDHDVLIVTFDHEFRPVNTITPSVLSELDELLGSLAQGGHVRAVIFTSGKPDVFITGADIFEMSQMDTEQITSFLSWGQRVYDRIERLPIPTVAAINGTCLGGGLELALACDHRVAADKGSISIGLPEVSIGLIPAWGGTTRMTRKIGLLRTLPAMLAGKTMPPRKALKLGIIDEVVRPEALLAAARRLAGSKTPPSRLRRIDRIIQSNRLLMHPVLKSARRQTLAKVNGHYPAPLALIDVAEVAATSRHEESLRAEREAAKRLASTDVCQNLMRLFFLRSEAKKRIKNGLDAEPMPVNHAAVVGGGTMGAGIVHALVRQGISVRLIEINTDAVSAALGRVRKMLDDDVRSKKLSRLEADRAMRLVSPTIGINEHAGLHLADIVIEAVAENMDIKLKVFDALSRLTRRDTVLATNTSSLSIDELARLIEDPTRRGSIIGLHFFNPVPKMPLVEVVRGQHSDGRALAAGASLALRIGKTPIVVNDGPGFLVNRVLIPYLAEALALASEGVSITDIDEAMRAWGMPMGPFELLDQVGLDVAHGIFQSIGGLLGEHIVAPRGLDGAVELGWLGKKTGIGFFVYNGKKRKGTPVNEGMIELLLARNDANGTEITPQDIAWRLLLPMVNETARLVLEGVIDSTDMIDLATVLGLGLAPFRGGLVRFVETAGLEQIVKRMEALAEDHGERFAPVTQLRQLVEAKGSLQDLVNAAGVKQVATDTQPTNGETTTANVETSA